MPARRADLVALRSQRIGFARKADQTAALAVVVQNDDLCAVAAQVLLVPLVRVAGAQPAFPGWVVLDGEPDLGGRWIAATDELRRASLEAVEPGVRGRLSDDAMRRIGAALRWVFDL
ncbi:MAG: hypothetical protein AABZ30_01310 [Myxococcota bacterium]